MYATSNLAFATGIRLITPGPNPLGFTARGIRANTQGVVTFMARDGTTATLNVQAGEIIPVEILIVTASTAQLHGFI